MLLDMRPDRVLITCEALGLHHAQATQASSSHIVMDLAAILSVPSRTLSDGESDFLVSLLATVRWLLAHFLRALDDFVCTLDARSQQLLLQQRRSHQRTVPGGRSLARPTSC